MQIFDANPPEITQRLQTLVKNYPTHDKYGIDYSDQINCPIVTCAVFYNGYTLLAHRGASVAEYPGMWAMIGGFLLPRPPADAVLEELNEEAGIQPSDVTRLYVAPMRVRLDRAMRLNDSPPYKYKRRWYEFRCMVELNAKTTPVTNWENRELKWMPVREALKLPLLPSNRTTLAMWQRARTKGVWPTGLSV